MFLLPNVASQPSLETQGVGFTNARLAVGGGGGLKVGDRNRLLCAWDDGCEREDDARVP